ncbi:MAG: transcriptional regulator NrdR [Nanoarchaeota archaeon]
MLCPYCQNKTTKVTDKRDSGSITKRRRECLRCKKRFNTREALEEMNLRVIKKDSRQEAFDREKLRRGILKACEKRPINAEKIDKMIINIEENLRKRGKDVKTEVIGGLVSKELKKVDKVAYIRFASVYREFDDVADFKNEIKELNNK